MLRDCADDHVHMRRVSTLDFDSGCDVCDAALAPGLVRM